MFSGGIAKQHQAVIVLSKEESIKFAESMGINAVTFKKLSTAGFRSYRIALSNWIMPYYKQVKKVRTNGKAYLKFHRLVDIQRVNRNNWYFEKREEGVYRNHVKMKEILTKLIKKHHQSHVIEGMERDGYFKQKSGSRHVKN